MTRLDLPPSPAKSTVKSPIQRRPVPPLENGDRLSDDEFMRRYEAMPDVKAELIDGIVYMASPVRTNVHGQPHADLVGWLTVYRSRHPHLILGDNSSVLLGPGDRVQPDAFLMLPRDRGGRAELRDDGYIYGPPELVCEVAASTASLDANDKANAYHRAGVVEYLLWRTEEVQLDWFTLDGEIYRRLPSDENGLIESRVFPGLRLDRPALLRGDLAAVLRAVSAPNP